MSGSAEPRRPAPARQVLEPLMTVEELAAYLHKPVNMIYKMRAEGTGSPGYRAGKHLLFNNVKLLSGSKITAMRSEDEPRPLWRPAVPYRRPTHCSRLR